MLPCTTIITLSIHSRYLKTRLISTSATPQPHTHTHTQVIPPHPFTHTHTHHLHFHPSRRGALLHCPPHTPLRHASLDIYSPQPDTLPPKSAAPIFLTTTYTRIHPASQPASHTRGTLSLTTTTLRRASADTYSPQGDTLPPKWGARTFITPCTFRCTSAHHTLLHQRVAIHHIDA